jgi:hypothetical protein
VQYAANCGGAVAFTSQFANQILVNGTSFSASGDSGSLVVTSAQARPVGLLFADVPGVATVANPIGDVIAAFKTATATPAIIGGADHLVSCEPSGTVKAPTLSGGPSSVSAVEMQRAEGIQQRNAAQLMRDSAVTRVEAGASADNPTEAALVLYLSSAPNQPVPATVEGLRTRVVLPAAVTQQAHLAAADVDRAIAVKETHVGSMMAQPGIQGIGVAVSEDNPLEPAVLILTVIGEQHPPIPATLDGVRTKVIESEHVRAFGWGKETVNPVSSCAGKASSPTPKMSLRGRL